MFAICFRTFILLRSVYKNSLIFSDVVIVNCQLNCFKILSAHAQNLHNLRCNFECLFTCVPLSAKSLLVFWPIFLLDFSLLILISIVPLEKSHDLVNALIFVSLKMPSFLLCSWKAVLLGSQLYLTVTFFKHYELLIYGQLPSIAAFESV